MSRRLKIRRRGVALLLVLLVVALLSASTLTFIRMAHLEAKVADNAYMYTQAQFMARSGLKGAMTLLALDDATVDTLTDSWTTFDQYAAMAGGFFEEGSFAGRIEDLCNRIDPNYLIDSQGLMVTERINVMTRLADELGLDPAFINAMLDWLDPDEETRPDGGAEGQYYNYLERPYNCANGRIYTTGQLRLIRGLTPEILDGTEERPGLGEFLTVDSSGLVNINTAPEAVLVSLDDDLTPAVAQEIIELRATDPFLALDDLKNITTLTPEARLRIGPLVDIKSTHFRIVIEGQFREARAVIEAVVKRSDQGVWLVYYREG